jgi:hypothetical protein
LLTYLCRTHGCYRDGGIASKVHQELNNNLLTVELSLELEDSYRIFKDYMLATRTPYSKTSSSNIEEGEVKN